MSNTVKVIAAGVGGLILGSVGTYFVARRRIELKYAMILDQEIDDVKKYYEEYYRRVRKDDGTLVYAGEIGDELESDITVETKIRFEPDFEEDEGVVTEDEFPEEDVMVVEEILVKNQYLAVKDEETKRNIQDHVVSEDEVGEEVPSPKPMFPERVDGKPYPITHEEWGEEYIGSTRYDKNVLRYYEDDDVLCDELDSIINDKDSVIGIANLSYFGLGSEDDDIVYVRNEDVETDFEIHRNRKAYTGEVLGLPFAYTNGEHKSKKSGKMRDDE